MARIVKNDATIAIIRAQMPIHVSIALRTAKVPVAADESIDPKAIAGREKRSNRFCVICLESLVTVLRFVNVSFLLLAIGVTRI